MWQNVKNERGGSRKVNESRQHRFGGFRTSLALRRSSVVLEPDYADITKEDVMITSSFFLIWVIRDQRVFIFAFKI